MLGCYNLLLWSVQQQCDGTDRQLLFGMPHLNLHPSHRKNSDVEPPTVPPTSLACLPSSPKIFIREIKQKLRLFDSVYLFIYFGEGV